MLQPRGYSLPMVLMLMSVLAAAGTAAVVVMTSTAEATGTMINRRQAFYACDGVGRAAMVKSRDYIRTDASPTTAELQTSVCGAVGTCPNKTTFEPSGFVIDTLSLSTTGLQACTANADCASNLCQTGFCSLVRALPNGPFRGMNARQTDLNVIVEATKSATSARCRIEENISLGEIGLFQFFVFAEGYTDLIIPPTMTINGRVHVNGDFCGYGDAGRLKIDTVTASGGIFSGSHCPRFALGGNAAHTFAILDQATTSTYRVIGGTNDHTCTTCTPTPGTGAWAPYAQTRWNGNAQDSAHNVPVLRLPVVGTAAVQDGLDVSGDPVDNSQSLKMLLDPVRAGDNASILSQRYASKADIVIINGIWFKKTTGVPWPGTPIWSDHPGVYQTNCADEEGAAVCAGGATAMGVGQATLYPGATKPTHYSYYVHNGTTELRAPDFAQRPVVSYGAVSNQGANAFRPAFWLNTTTLSPTTNAFQALQGTRSGMKDFRVDAGAGANAAKILPMNFDIDAFTQALNDTTADELGDHFADGADAGSAPDFNGIVYIANTWPDWDQGMSIATTADAGPPLWPRVDDSDPAACATPPCATAGLTAFADARVNTRLPRNLCETTNASTLLVDADGPAAGATPLLTPDCADTTLTRPNALRIINGATINPTTFPNGLAIASNQGVYIMGNLNSDSATFVSAVAVPMMVPVNTTAPFATWRPLMIGGDAITLLSNAWNDFDADWTDPRNAAQRTLRNPTTTTWAFASISGSVETSTTQSSGGLNNFPRFLEDWGNNPTQATRIFGSLVVGFRSSKQRQPFPPPFTNFGVNDQFAYTAPLRQWVYDTNFNLPANQPPGTPSFFVQAVQTWKRE